MVHAENEWSPPPPELGRPLPGGAERGSFLRRGLASRAWFVFAADVNPRKLLGVWSLVALAAACGDDSGTGGGNGGSASAGAGDQGGQGTGASNDGGGSVAGGGQGTGASSSGGSSEGGGGGGVGPTPVKTVFIITMENHSWSTIENNASAPFINDELVPMAARAANYKTPPGLHPSEPNYIWIEAGSNLGISTDDPPADNHQSTTEHLTTMLEAANITWKAYAEDIPGDDCPLEDVGQFSPKHTPQLFFDDVTDNNDAGSQHCIKHVRPYTELADDLDSGDVARYNFITPNLCNDMHGEVLGLDCNVVFDDLIQRGDNFLAEAIPMIMASAAYQDGGAIFVWWDEGDESLSGASDGPLPFFVISANAKAGYTGNVAYTHSSTLRSLQEIFGVQPFLRDAANATDLSDLFTSFP